MADRMSVGIAANRARRRAENADPGQHAEREHDQNHFHFQFLSVNQGRLRQLYPAVNASAQKPSEASLPAKPQPPASIRRLERKVDQLAADAKADREALGLRLDTLNLNGSAAALHNLAASSEKLLKLAEVSDYIVASVAERREREVVGAWARRVFNPFTSKLGALIWVVISAVVFVYVSRFIH